MVLTNNKISAFFDNASQMALPHAAVVQLINEGISEPSDLNEFDQSLISQIADNLRHPRGRVVDPNYPTATIPTPPFIFVAKSQQRHNVAYSMICFCALIGRGLTASNLQYTPIMGNFKELWKAIVDRIQTTRNPYDLKGPAHYEMDRKVYRVPMMGHSMLMISR